MILNKNIRCISYIYGPGNHQAKEIKTSYSIITRLEEREIKITKISPITSRITYSGFSLCCLYFFVILKCISILYNFLDDRYAIFIIYSEKPIMLEPTSFYSSPSPGVKRNQSNVTCFDLIWSHQTRLLVRRQEVRENSQI